MLKVIKKGQGINKTEKRLIELANNAFIGLWSYPNVYSDEGYSKINLEKKFVIYW